MRRKVFAMALAALMLPALALASSPLLVRFDGHTVPVRETVQVTHTPAGTVRVHTWSWRAPDGAATFQVSETRGANAPMPAWALSQMRELQMQMRQMHRIEAAMEQPLQAPVAVAWGEPLLMPLPSLAPPLGMDILQPVIVPPALLPAGIIAIAPAAAAPHAATPAPEPHHGLST